jgi:predicted Holliday junction resolvase-like endonuclease
MAEQAQTIAELRQELEARNRDLAQSLQRENATASENVRLSKELQERNRDLTEALEQQTATGDVLRVIASSRTDL